MKSILNKLSYREKGLLLLCGLILTLAFWYSYFLLPLVSEWKEVNDEVNRKELMYQKFTKITGRKDITEHSYEQFINQLKITGSEEEEMAFLLKEIEGLARDKIYITNIKPHSVKDFGFYKQFNVEIDYEAQTEPLVKFIYEAERSKSLFRVGQLRLQIKSGKPDLLEGTLLVSKISIL